MIWLLRSLLLLVVFVGIMLPAAEDRPSFATAYNTCVKVLLCDQLHRASVLSDNGPSELTGPVQMHVPTPYFLQDAVNTYYAIFCQPLCPAA